MASRTTSRFWGRIGPFPLHSITSLCKLWWGLRFSHPYWWIYRSPGILRHANSYIGRLRLKCDGLRAEKRFRLSAKRTSPFKSSGASVQSSTGSRGVRISRSNAGYNMFRGSVKSTGSPLSSTFSPSPPLPTSPCAIILQLDSTDILENLPAYIFWVVPEKPKRGPPKICTYWKNVVLH